MYIVAIAWGYVTLLMALTEPSITAAILSFGFYGVVPLALLLWLFGTPQRRRDKAKSTSVEVDQVVGEPDRRDAGADQ